MRTNLTRVREEGNEREVVLLVVRILVHLLVCEAEGELLIVEDKGWVMLSRESTELVIMVN